MKLSRRFWLYMVIAASCPLSTASAAEGSNDKTASTSPAPIDDPQFGTIQLFNGSNLDGLQVFLEDPAADASQTFKVEDGILRVSGKPRGYIRTQMPYADYKLHVEWRFPNGKSNSGVILHIVNRDEIWPKAFEAQLATDRAGDINIFWDARSKEESLGRTSTGFSTGRLSRPAVESAEKPLGEWNAFDIVAAGDTLTLTVNGVLVNRMTGLKPSAGMIGLQSEGGAIDFRNMTLTPLPPAIDLHTPMPTAK